MVLLSFDVLCCVMLGRVVACCVVLCCVVLCCVVLCCAVFCCVVLRCTVPRRDVSSYCIGECARDGKVEGYLH